MRYDGEDEGDGSEQECNDIGHDAICGEFCPATGKSAKTAHSDKSECKRLNAFAQKRFVLM